MKTSELLKIIQWINKVLPKTHRGDTIGYISCGGNIEELIVCDKYGDELDIKSLKIKGATNGKLSCAHRVGKSCSDKSG